MRSWFRLRSKYTCFIFKAVLEHHPTSTKTSLWCFDVTVATQERLAGRRRRHKRISRGAAGEKHNKAAAARIRHWALYCKYVSIIMSGLYEGEQGPNCKCRLGECAVCGKQFFTAEKMRRVLDIQEVCRSVAVSVIASIPSFTKTQHIHECSP